MVKESESDPTIPNSQLPLLKKKKAPKTVVSELIIQRLKSKECIEKGWVLDGYPTSVIEAEELKSKGITPNR